MTNVQSVLLIGQSVVEFIEVFRSMTNCRICRRIVMEHWANANEKRCSVGNQERGLIVWVWSIALFYHLSSSGLWALWVMLWGGVENCAVDLSLCCDLTCAGKLILDFVLYHIHDCILTYDLWPLTSDPWPLNSDLRPLTSDHWPPTDLWPFSSDVVFDTSAVGSSGDLLAFDRPDRAAVQTNARQKLLLSARPHRK